MKRSLEMEDTEIGEVSGVIIKENLSWFWYIKLRQFGEWRS